MDLLVCRLVIFVFCGLHILWVGISASIVLFLNMGGSLYLSTVIHLILLLSLLSVNHSLSI